MSATGAPMVLAAAAHGAVDFITGRGGDPERAAAQAGIALKELDHPNRPIDLGAYCGLFEAAAQHSGEDNLGLWFGQQFEPHMLGLIGDLALSSATLGEAVRDLAAHFHFHQSGTRTRLFAAGGLLCLEYRILDGRIVDRRQDAELTMGMFCNLFRHALGKHWAPEEVHLEHARPQGARDHEQAFQAPVYFNRGSNMLLFRPDRLDRAMPGADAQAKALLLAQLRTVATSADLSFHDRVVGEIRSRLAAGEIRIADIAASLHMSASTLLRRLDGEGCGFFDLVEQTRGQQAQAYLEQKHIPLSEIALLLGYSELSSFSRAFKRWMGVSPQQHRARLFARG